MLNMALKELKNQELENVEKTCFDIVVFPAQSILPIMDKLFIRFHHIQKNNRA